MKVLVTGFEPFGGDTINPSGEILNHLPKNIAGAEIKTLVVPVTFKESAEAVKRFLEKEPVDVVISIGLATGRAIISPERVAINQDDAFMPDNAGDQPVDEAIQVDGPAAYFSTLPIKAIVKAIQEAGIPSSVSNSAGTYVCNHLMYELLHVAHQSYPGMRVGFIHVPSLPEQIVTKVRIPSMPLETMVKGMIKAIEAVVEYTDKEDLRLIGGSIC